MTEEELDLYQRGFKAAARRMAREMMRRAKESDKRSEAVQTESMRQTWEDVAAAYASAAYYAVKLVGE